MNNVKSIMQARIKKRQQKELLDWLMLQIFWQLMIDEDLDQDEVKLVIGYPEEEHLIYAISKWIEQNNAMITGLKPVPALNAIYHSLCTIFDTYYGGRHWQRPDQYER